ncbi:NAD(P)-binding protein [Pseudovirgaria hyperparasitica]|uniref:NAD(P)-binding protein n=1 Tax=Pseudovirgaria hyperparasitica TaxID=470096 RepID=A0A6A6WM24_9PEZI|nr:NAD(P)-binding protein [Pseudovirgaria hyperparasitica]KAF2763212.1 NAD(P)-binding protein [Pseudovirgaria hyperparasitica]
MPSYVIAGASRGLGLQFIKTLSQDPSNTVIALARNPSSVHPLLPSLPNIHLLAADLTDPSSLRAAAASTSTLTNGTLDYLLINGAWINLTTQSIAPTDLASPANEPQLLTDVDTAFKTNFAGPLLCATAFLPLVRAGQQRKIVVISTGMADAEFVRVAGVWAALVYSASKAAVNMLVAKLAVELKDDGIVVASLSPGLVDTDGTEASKKNFEMLMPMFRKYEPEFQGPITPRESVEMQIRVIQGLTMAHAGQMWSHLGNQRWI